MGWTTRQDALAAVAAFAGGAVLLGARAYSVLPWPEHLNPYWRAIPLLVVCAAIPFRRTRPLTGLAIATPGAVADVLIGPSLPTLAIYTDALYASTLYGPESAPRRLLSATVTVTLLLSGLAGLLGRDLRGLVVTVAMLALVLVSPVLTAITLRQHRDRAHLERVRAEQVARLAELDRRSAVAAERARMARELHDIVANHLSAVALHSTAALSLRDVDVSEVLRVIRENSVRGLAEMRRMIGLLRGEEDDEPAVRPRLAEVGALAERARRPGLTVRLDAGDPGTLPAAVELAAYRIVQESLTNVAKHAGDGEASVVIAREHGTISVAVDSPLGGDTAVPGSGSGLVGMKERAALLGGTFAAGPLDGRWRVRAVLPVHDEPVREDDT